jgi:D-amino-acid dehydrogenase
MLGAVSALTTLSKLSLQMYRELDQASPGAFGFSQRGLVMIAQSGEGMRAAIEEMELVARHDIPGTILNADEVKKCEPAARGAGIVGGVFFPDEAHVEPLATVKHLMELATRGGMQLLEHTELLDFERRKGRVESISTTRGEIRADKFVLATGAWSGRLASQIGLPLPMLSGKGYAVIVPPLKHMPRIPVMIIERKIAITPRSDSLRIAGTLELVDLDESVTMRRVQTLMRGAATLLDMPRHPEVKEIWRGLRPCTPDGVPVIGVVPKLPNVYIAAGHQMLGLQMGVGSGRLMADLVTGSEPCVDPMPFRADRFA